jgi:hypothetical protein
LISAIDVYKVSGKHVMVTEAVDKVFEEEGSGNPNMSISTQQLMQIALENRLGMSQ